MLYFFEFGVWGNALTPVAVCVPAEWTDSKTAVSVSIASSVS